ncbi:Membrane spanning protein, required for outer membrane integrity [Flavobacterium sp. 9AF]|uniref:AsmA-like C-terminal region-containing protein n=1 Tax=Flavobacterium sp. 9AF TaxID=2653142 RepID=UPI0012F14583|nr:AsmA-like C-terminal region-containing protein [Flavobacterium sp. 9AF]VXC00402.1 Membrane spanning protein, required for outer membrane integrity [Flavobacterium sp. 9AF]
MAKNKKLVLKIFKITVIAFVSLLALLIVLPIIFSDTITNKVKVFANENLEGELNFKNSSLSFFTHFPSLTLTLEEFNLKGSEPFQDDELIEAKEIGFGIDVMSLIFGNQTEIDKIYLNKANINIQVNTKGEANYNVYKSTDSTTSKNETPTSLQLKKIQIDNSILVYNDASIKMAIEAKGFNYKGKGNLLDADFKLATSAQIDSLSFSYDANEYLKNKKVKADLITKINTNSLAFIFEKNNLIINKLPVEFSGFFNFLSNGYDMDFNLKTENSNLEDLFSALPSEYISWKDQTDMKGKTNAHFTLKGKYIASQKLNPEINFKMDIKDGYIKNKKAPYPLENIYLNLETKLPNLDVNQLNIKLDSLFFTLNQSKLSATLLSNGLGNQMNIDAKLKSKIDLKLVNDALQIPDFKLTGLLDADLISKGVYNKQKRKFPVTKGYFHLSNGTIQTAYYPKPIEKINLKATLNCPTTNFSDASFTLAPANFSFEKEPFTTTASFVNFDDISYTITAKGKLNITNIYKVFSQDGLAVNGFIKADLNLQGKQSDATNGNYKNLKNSGTLEIVNLETTSDYLPKPFLIENGLFTFNQDQMHFSNFHGKYGQSDIVMNGYLSNVINFVLSENEIIRGTFDLKSNFLNINEFIPAQTTATKPTEKAATTETGVVEIPKNLDLTIQAHTLKTKYDDINIENLRGKLSLQNGILNLSNASLGIIGATATMNAMYKNEGKQKAYFDYTIKANDFDIKRAYNEIAMFKEIVTAAAHAEGIISLDYKLKGVLNESMQPVLPSLEGNGTLSVKQVKMKGFKLLNHVAQKTESNAIKDPDITKVDIKSTIKNNLLTIERFKFKVSGFRLRFEGQNSLDGKLNLKMRIGLPPLGIIGIPIKVTGTQENPIIKLGNKSEDLEETEYIDGVTPLNNAPDSTAIPVPKIVKDTFLKPSTVPVEKVKDSIPQKENE